MARNQPQASRASLWCPEWDIAAAAPAPDIFDKVGVLEQWVEHGTAPDKIIAAHRTKGVEDMTRPLCPYPEVAKWKGSGSTNDAANFDCVMRSQK